MKEVIKLDAGMGYPKGPAVFYECTKCHDVLPSDPPENLWCRCYNIAIDVDAGRLGIQDDACVEVFRMRPDDPNGL